MSNLTLPKRFGQPLNLGHWSTENLVFYFRGIEDIEARDESLYSNHGTLVGPPTWVGDGLEFNGSNQKVAAGPITNNGKLTVIVKFKVGAGAAWPDALFSIDSGNLVTSTFDCNIHYNSGDYRVYVSDGSSVQFIFITDAEIDASVINTIAATIDGSTIKVYLNSVRLRDEAQTIGVLNSGHNLNIGAVTSTYYWPGTVYDVKVYVRDLSASEIAALYINPDLPMQQEPPVWLGQVPVGGFKPYWAVNNNVLIGAA